MSSCGQHSWCCQPPNKDYCCDSGTQFNLSYVQDNYIQIPLTPSASSSLLLPTTTAAANTIGSPSASKDATSRTIALSVGLGVPFGLALVACLYLLVRNIRQARQAAATHKEAELEIANLKAASGPVETDGDGSVAEMQGYHKFELHGSQGPVEIPTWRGACCIDSGYSRSWYVLSSGIYRSCRFE